RRLADGDLEFLGRIDQQVKVRGVRVEPGEIEALLAEHPRIGEAAVVAAGEPSGTADPGGTAGPGGRLRLIAYVVPRPCREEVAAAAMDGGATAAEPEAGELRDFLAARLPAAMVPSAFVRLAAMPLAPTGKIDRRALAQLQPAVAPLAAAAAYAAPGTRVERLLAGIWGEVLGSGRRGVEIGIHDNFFDLGGDSILSIQVAARAAQSGCRITPKQLFECQTIAELALAADTVSALAAEQGAVSGPLPLTPIQHWFLAQRPIDPQHFNQSLLMRPARPLAPAVVARAWGAVLLHHDALRLRFAEEGGRWRQWCAAPAGRVPFAHVDLAALGGGGQGAPIEGGAAAAALATSAGQAQSSFDLDGGPLARAVWYSLGGGVSRLLLVVHHLAIDAVSWPTLLADLETACRQAAAGQAIRLPAKTTSYREWAERLSTRARELVSPPLAWWMAQLEGAPALPVDLQGGRNLQASERTVTVWLDAEETSRLLLAPEPRGGRGAQVEELLLAALVHTLARWTGPLGAPAVDVEGHGREQLFGDLDLTRTIGWFTNLYPLRLTVPPQAGPIAVLAALREHRSALAGAGGGLGYGLLRFLDEEAAPRLAALPAAPVAFNYLGQLDAAGDDRLFVPTGEPCGPLRSPHALRSHLLLLNGVIVGGRLRVDWSYSENLHRRGTVEQLAAELAGCLQTLLRQRPTSPVRGAAAADFPWSGLDAAALARLLAAEPRIEDLYPLSPLQEGILFHCLSAPGGGFYVEQVSCRLGGELDAEALAAAWRRVVARHPVLRTALRWRELPRPLQAVLSEAEVELELLDWRHLPASEQEWRWHLLLRADRRRGFDLERAPLMRWTLVRTGQEQHRFLWTHHHVLLDGWSYGAVVGEFLACYEGLRSGAEPRLQERPPFRDYIVWRERQDGALARAHWARRLLGLSRPTPVPGQREPGARAALWRSSTAWLDRQATAALQSWARRHQLTLNTLLQGAWAMLLGGPAKAAGDDSVLFGTTIAGRPPELAGVEAMVGLLIDTLPVRVDLGSPAQPLIPWLRRLQREQAELRHHGYASLVEIQGASAIPRGLPLFTSLLIFENYPRDAALRQPGGPLARLLLDEQRVAGQMSYPLTLYGLPGEELALRIDHDGARFEPGAIERLLRGLVQLLRGMAEETAGASAERRMAELMPFAEAEQRQLRGGRRSLPPPTAAAHREAVPTLPRNSLERVLAAIWSELLAGRQIGIHDGFFAAGGDSLLALRLAARLEEVLGVEVPLPLLLGVRDIAELAELLAGPDLAELLAGSEPVELGSEPARLPATATPPGGGSAVAGFADGSSVHLSVPSMPVSAAADPREG
ncbi:MAG TPA: condensation domain-containing protein, partial [Thermoanaerobaculia bacterium]|nr:condensation domain-containing protein [Thermoanaerobaculia bacterium]